MPANLCMVPYRTQDVPMPEKITGIEEADPIAAHMIKGLIHSVEDSFIRLRNHPDSWIVRNLFEQFRQGTSVLDDQFPVAKFLLEDRPQGHNQILPRRIQNHCHYRKNWRHHSGQQITLKLQVRIGYLTALIITGTSR